MKLLQIACALSILIHSATQTSGFITKVTERILKFDFDDYFPKYSPSLQQKIQEMNPSLLQVKQYQAEQKKHFKARLLFFVQGVFNQKNNNNRELTNINIQMNSIESKLNESNQKVHDINTKIQREAPFHCYMYKIVQIVPIFTPSIVLPFNNIDTKLTLVQESLQVFYDQRIIADKPSELIHLFLCSADKALSGSLSINPVWSNPFYVEGMGLGLFIGSMLFGHRYLQKPSGDLPYHVFTRCFGQNFISLILRGILALTTTLPLSAYANSALDYGVNKTNTSPRQKYWLKYGITALFSCLFFVLTMKCHERGYTNFAFAQ